MDQLTKNKKLRDKLCKKYLSLVDVVSKILELCIPEYKGLTKEEIVKCLDIDKNNPRFIKTLSNEDISVFDNYVNYDVLFTSRLPNSNEYIPMYINLEAQNSNNVDYRLVSRAMLYVNRIFSRQKPDYNNLRKAYSIWICTTPFVKQRNTINRYVIKEICELGNYKEDKKYYAFTEVIMINLGGKYDEKTSSGILQLLNLIFNNASLEIHEVETTLKSKFDIMLEKKEVEQMCTLSEGLYQEGIRVGKQEGIRVGKQEGIRVGELRGELRGERNGIKKVLLELAKPFIKLGLSKEEAFEKLNLPNEYKELFYSMIEEIQQ